MNVGVIVIVEDAEGVMVGVKGTAAVQVEVAVKDVVADGVLLVGVDVGEGLACTAAVDVEVMEGVAVTVFVGPVCSRG